jgi:galactonate dehydratase
MNIQSIELFLVPPRWLFLKITTSDGLVGWGEPVVEGRAATVKTAVEEMSDYLIGKDAGAIEDIWQVLYRSGFYRGGPILTSAISGIDQALWDIKGKHYQAPVWDLLGGRVRDKVRAMLVIPYGTIDEVAQSCKKAADDGYTALKVMVYQPEHHLMAFGAKVKDMVERMALIREVVGWDVEIGIEIRRQRGEAERRKQRVLDGTPVRAGRLGERRKNEFDS